MGTWTLPIAPTHCGRPHLLSISLSIPPSGIQICSGAKSVSTAALRSCTHGAAADPQKWWAMVKYLPQCNGNSPPQGRKLLSSRSTKGRTLLQRRANVSLDIQKISSHSESVKAATTESHQLEGWSNAPVDGLLRQSRDYRRIWNKQQIKVFLKRTAPYMKSLEQTGGNLPGYVASSSALSC